MRRFCRRLVRLFLLLPWLICMGIIAVPVTLRRDKWRAVKGMTKLIRYWGAGLLKIFHVNLAVTGDVAAYNGELVVSNHTGYLDICVHAAVFGLRFCPKSDIRSWPVLGWYTSFTHPIWIDRSSRLKSKEALAEFCATLEHKVPLIIYPEGTSTDGTHVLPFKSSPFEAAAEGGFPVLPVVTLYRVPDGEDSPCWYGDIKFIPHLWKLVGIPRIECEVHVLDPIAPAGRSRKEIAALTHRAIAEAHAEYLNPPPDSPGTDAPHTEALA